MKAMPHVEEPVGLAYDSLRAAVEGHNRRRKELLDRVQALTQALITYANCRHGNLECPCTKEARAALFVEVGPQ